MNKKSMSVTEMRTPKTRTITGATEPAGRRARASSAFHLKEEAP